jgi:hypothetical protein
VKVSGNPADARPFARFGAMAGRLPLALALLAVLVAARARSRSRARVSSGWSPRRIGSGRG